MEYTWTQNLTEEQVETIKAQIPAHLVKRAERDAKFLANPPDTLDAQGVEAYRVALAAHQEIDAFILKHWAQVVQVEDGVASATFDWGDAPVDEPWELPFISDRVWGTLRAVPLHAMSNALLDSDKFEAAVALLEAVDGRPL